VPISATGINSSFPIIGRFLSRENIAAFNYTEDTNRRRSGAVRMQRSIECPAQFDRHTSIFYITFVLSVALRKRRARRPPTPGFFIFDFLIDEDIDDK